MNGDGEDERGCMTKMCSETKISDKKREKEIHSNSGKDKKQKEEKTKRN